MNPALKQTHCYVKELVYFVFIRKQVCSQLNFLINLRNDAALN
jgi:hypothetical protein